MTNKEKISSLSLCLGICMGFISRNGLYDEFKEEYGWVLDTVDMALYLNDKKKVVKEKSEAKQKGGYASAAKLTSEQRKARAKKAADARWGK